MKVAILLPPPSRYKLLWKALQSPWMPSGFLHYQLAVDSFVPSQPRLVFFADLKMLLQVRSSWLGCTGKDLLAMVTDTLVSILFGSGELLPHSRPWDNQLLRLYRLRWCSRCCICIGKCLLVLLVFTLHLNISLLVIKSWGCHLQEKKISISFGIYENKTKRTNIITRLHINEKNKTYYVQ